MRTFLRVAALLLVAAAGSHRRCVDAAGAPSAMLAERARNTDPSVRARAAIALGHGEAPAKDAIPLLAELLRDKDFSVRWAAAWGLAGVGADAVPTLEQSLQAHEWPVRAAAAEALGYIGPAAKGAAPLLAGLLRDEEAGVRGSAAVALQNMGPAAKDAVPMLVRRLRDSEWEVRWSAAWTLGQIGADARDVVGPLGNLLRDSEPAVRCAAARSLGWIGPKAKDAVPALVALLRDQDVRKKNNDMRPNDADVLLGADRLVIGAVVCALGRIGPAAKEAIPLLPGRSEGDAETGIWAMASIGPDAVPALQELSRKNDKAAALALSYMRPLAKADIPVIAGRLRDKDPQVRGFAALALGRMGIDAMPAVLELLRGKAALPGDDYAVVLAKISATFVVFAEISATGPEAAHRVNELLRDKDPKVRAAAALAISVNPAGKEAVPVLAEMLRDRGADLEDGMARNMAVAALGALGPAAKDAAPVLLEAMRDRRLVDEWLFGHPAVALYAMGPAAKEAIPGLTQLLADKNPHLRGYAALALGRMGPAAIAAVPALVRILRENPLGLRNENGPSRALARIGAPAVPALKDLLREKKDEVTRCAVVRVFGSMGPAAKDAVPELTKLLHDKDREVCRTAVVALGKIGPAAKDAVVPLAKLLADDNRSEMRFLVGDALVAIGPAAIPTLKKIVEIDFFHSSYSPKDDWLANDAAGLLNRIRPEGIAALKALSHDKRIKVRQAVASGLSARRYEIAPDAAAAALLTELLKDEDWQVRDMAASGLWLLRHPKPRNEPAQQKAPRAPNEKGPYPGPGTSLQTGPHISDASAPSAAQPAAARPALESKVVATATIDGKLFFGAAARPDTFFVLVDDTLYAYAVSGAQRWQKRAPWYEFRSHAGAGERRLLNGPPNFSRPAPVATSSGVVVVSYKDDRLFLDAYDPAGNQTATVKLLPHNMKLQQGLLHLGKTAHGIAFGYRLAMDLPADNPDRGVLLFDEGLHRLHEYNAWGDNVCFAGDGSVYAPTERWGKDIKWARILPDGRMDLLPASVSRYTFVLQPGIGSQIILWGGRENSEGGRPDGSRDTIGTRRIWQPSSPDASAIYEFWGGWLGEMVACSSNRYLLRIWPRSKQEFICLNGAGKTLWEHKLTLSCYFWPPRPLCAPDGTLYVMDTVRSADGQTNDVVLRSLTPSGQTSWELKIDQTKEPPFFESWLTPSGSHMLLVRRDQHAPRTLSVGSPKLIFVDLGWRRLDGGMKTTQ